MIDYKLVKKLVSNYDFVYRVRNYFELVKETGVNSDLSKHYYKSFLRISSYILDVDLHFEKFTYQQIKAISYARDLIKMNNYKVICRNDYLNQMLNNQFKSYPRVTKDDVYFRDFEAEHNEWYDRLGHCGGYDCMHFEDMPIREIWRKVEDNHKEYVGDYIPELEEIAHNRENRK